MTAKQPTKTDWDAPVLIVKYGNAARRQFVLDNGSTVLGRARGCDVELESPDISTVHCVICRTPEGLTMRDLNSRSGTKVNGERIKGEKTLRDADVIQIGPFSFDLAVPSTVAPSVTAERALTDAKTQVERLERSRERMAEMALALRRRLSVERAARRVVAAPGGKTAEVEEAVRGIADRQSEVERWAAKVEEHERTLAAQRAEIQHQHEQLRVQSGAYEDQVAKLAAEQQTFDREREEAIKELSAYQEALEKRQAELSQHQAKVDAEIQSAYKELERACAQGRNAAATGQVSSADDSTRKRELSSFAHFLRQYRHRLFERREELNQREKDLNQAWGILLAEQDRLMDDQRRLAERRPQFASPNQSAQVASVLDGLSQLLAESRRLQDAELRALRQACEKMAEPAPEEPSLLVTARGPDAAPSGGVKRGRLTERVNIAALLDRLGQSNS
jgi:pSer/pThr/pTyr-binding forkhead associated (FHA) protein